MSSQETDNGPPVAESGPSVLMIIGAAVGGFFGLVILYVAMKAVCSSCKEQTDKKRDTLERNKVGPKEQISTIKLQKPVVTYDGPTHNNIPVVRAGEDPNSIALKRKTQPVRGMQRSLASSMIKERRENGGPVDHETYTTRREIEEQIIENRRRQQLHQLSQESGDSYGSGRLECFQYVNEMNGHARTHRVFTDTLEDDRRLRLKKNKELDDNILRNGGNGLIKGSMKEVPLANIPSERQNGGPRVRDGVELPRQDSRDLSRFKPQELPADWLPPSKKSRQLRSSPPSRKIAPVELDARDLRPDFRRGEEKKHLRKMNDSHANRSFEDDRLPRQDEFGGILRSDANRPVKPRAFDERDLDDARDYARNVPRDSDPRDRDRRDIRDRRDYERSYQIDQRDDRPSRRQIDPRDFRQGSDPSDSSERNFERRRDPRHERSSQRDPRDFAERQYQREIGFRDELDRDFARSSQREIRDDFRRDARDFRQGSDPSEFLDNRNYQRQIAPRDDIDRDFADKDFVPQERAPRRAPPVFARDNSREELPQPIKKKKRRVIATT